MLIMLGLGKYLKSTHMGTTNYYDRIAQVYDRTRWMTEAVAIAEFEEFCLEHYGSFEQILSSEAKFEIWAYRAP
jgi:hypothetical protein